MDIKEQNNTTTVRLNDKKSGRDINVHIHVTPDTQQEQGKENEPSLLVWCFMFVFSIPAIYLGYWLFKNYMSFIDAVLSLGN